MLRLALIDSLPVEVLMKSAPAIIQTIDAFATFLSVSKSPTPSIALICLFFAAFLNSLTSSYNFFQLFCRTKPLLITISISSAPFLIDSIISSFLVLKDESPAGKPVETAATGIFFGRFFLASLIR